MKRLFAFAVTILTAVCMFACSAPGKSKSTKPNGLSSSFQAAASVVIGDLNAEGTLKRFGDGVWEIEFSSPNTLSGVKLSFNENGTEASYKGLNFSVPQSALPVKSMMLNLISAVDDLAKNEQLTGNEEDGMLKISGNLDGGEYVLTVDRNGNIVSFAMPNNDLMMEFRDIVPISEEITSTTEAPTETASAETTEAVTTEAA